MKLSNFVIASFAVLFINVTLIGDAAAENPICAGWKGAAFGQCTAAVAVGCDGSINQPKGCAKIEENFTRLSGESAPWVIGPCSCYSFDEAVFFLNESLLAGEALSWSFTTRNNPRTGEPFSKFFEVGVNARIHPYFSSELIFEPSLGGAFGTCGNFAILDRPLYSAEEANSCWAAVTSAVEILGVPEDQ